MTVADLIRALTERSVELPPTRQRKSHYVQMFRNHAAAFSHTNPFQSPAKGTPKRSFAPGLAPVHSTRKNTPLKENLVPSQQFSSPFSKKLEETKLREFAVADKLEEMSFGAIGTFEEDNLNKLSVTDDPEERNSGKSPLSQKLNENLFSDTLFTASPGRFAKKSIQKRAKHQSYLRYAYIVCAILVTWYISFVSRGRIYCQENQIVNSTCTPCPVSTICSKDSILACNREDFRVRNSLISYVFPLRLLPFPVGQPYCEIDGIKTKREQQINTLIRMLDFDVRSWIGAQICTSGVDSAYDWVYSTSFPTKVIGMPQSLAKLRLQSQLPKWSNDSFEEYWLEILDRISRRDSEIPISSIVDEKTHSKRLLASENPPQMSMLCRSNRFFWRSINQYAIHLIVFGLLVAALFGGSLHFELQRREIQITASLYESVIDAVHSETENHHIDPVRHPLPGLSVSQLRDHFLPKVSGTYSDETWNAQKDNNGRLVYYTNDLRGRTRMWQRVQNQVLANSNLRESLLTVKGEAHSVWMWIGSDNLAPTKRGSAAVSQLL